MIIWLFWMPPPAFGALRTTNYARVRNGGGGWLQMLSYPRRPPFVFYGTQVNWFIEEFQVMQV